MVAAINRKKDVRILAPWGRLGSGRGKVEPAESFVSKGAAAWLLNGIAHAAGSAKAG
jgi:hypothetical protein